MTIREEIILRIRNWVNDSNIDIGHKKDQEILTDAILAKIREALPEERPVSWTDLDNTANVALQSENYGWNNAIEACQQAFKDWNNTE